MLVVGEFVAEVVGAVLVGAVLIVGEVVGEFVGEVVGAGWGGAGWSSTGWDIKYIVSGGKFWKGGKGRK